MLRRGEGRFGVDGADSIGAAAASVSANASSGEADANAVARGGSGLAIGAGIALAVTVLVMSPLGGATLTVNVLTLNGVIGAVEPGATGAGSSLARGGMTAA